MPEAGRDPGIKLFGRTIPPPEGQAAVFDKPGKGADLDLMSIDSPSAAAEPCRDGGEKDVSREVTNGESKDQTLNNSKEIDWNEADATSSLNNKQQTHSSDDKATAPSKTELGQVNCESSGQEKVLKKPDKILPCPRCNSMDTKFCYYNNYNVNQPRHFCKNCQRYWTAGGTMRNVPVGAGRRKNKHSVSHYRHLMMSSDGITSPRVDTSDSTRVQLLPCTVPTPMPPSKANGAVLKFSQEAPLCQSVPSEQKGKDDSRDTATRKNGEEQSLTPFKGSNGVENDLSGKAVHVEKSGAMPSCNGLAPMQPMQCFPGPPWPYPWPPGWNNVAALAAGRCTSEVAYGQENCNPHPIPWNPAPMIAAPAFCPPTIPFPFVPASFWGCMSGWPNGAWNMPWIGAHGGLSSSSLTSNSECSGNKSANLGKHSRDLSAQGDEKGEKSLWIPKTLRIDDPDEAAKSSIWATLGIKLNQNEPSRKCDIFKAFQSKTEDSSHCLSEATHVLHANPAALSRSQTFQEST